MTATQKNLERLGHDLKHMATDLEDLLKGIPEDLNEEAVAARKRISATLDSTRGLCRRLERRAVEGVTATDEYVHENPWQFIMAAAGVGLLLGALFTRR